MQCTRRNVQHDLQDTDSEDGSGANLPLQGHLQPPNTEERHDKNGEVRDDIYGARGDDALLRVDAAALDSLRVPDLFARDTGEDEGEQDSGVEDEVCPDETPDDLIQRALASMFQKDFLDLPQHRVLREEHRRPVQNLDDVEVLHSGVSFNVSGGILLFPYAVPWWQTIQHNSM